MLKKGDKIIFTRAAMSANHNRDYRNADWEPTVVELISCVPLCWFCHRYLIDVQPWVINPQRIYPARCTIPDQHHYTEAYLYLVSYCLHKPDGTIGMVDGQFMINEHHWQRV